MYRPGLVLFDIVQQLAYEHLCREHERKMALSLLSDPVRDQSKEEEAASSCERNAAEDRNNACKQAILDEQLSQTELPRAALDTAEAGRVKNLAESGHSVSETGIGGSIDLSADTAAQMLHGQIACIPQSLGAAKDSVAKGHDKKQKKPQAGLKRSSKAKSKDPASLLLPWSKQQAAFLCPTTCRTMKATLALNPIFSQALSQVKSDQAGPHKSRTREEVM